MKNPKATLATIATVFALISSGAGGVAWVVDRLDNLVTKTELQILHLDLRLSMDEKTLNELDVLLDTQTPLTSKQKRIYEQLSASVPEMDERRNHLMGL